MKILLVYPQMPDTFYAMKHFMQVVGKKAAYPPLGLLTIAALFPTKWEKKLVDLNISPLSEKDLLWADYMFLSAMNVQEDSVREIIGICKHYGIKIVAGGPLFTHEYERFEEVDHFILNEAEITFPMFLKDLEDNCPQPIYATTEFAEIEKSPLPAFELADMRNYLYAIVQYSRGCPYMCDFCDVTALFGRRQRTKQTEQIIAELEAIARTGNVQLVLFADDNLIGNKAVLKSDLLPALIEWRKRRNPNFYFATQLTVNLADDEEMMQLMIDAGFRHVFIGIETPAEESLNVSHKRQNMKRDLLDAIYTLHSKGFIISGGFIVGFDADTHDIFKRQIDFIQKSGIPLPIVNILKAPPGTDLYERMKKENRLSKKFAFSEGDTNVVPIMGEYLLYQGFIEVIEHIYTPEKSYERLIRFFETYTLPKTSVKIKAKYSVNDVIMVWRIFFHLGIVKPERKYFWKLINWCLVNNKKMVDKALFYTIMIYQMSETYKTIYKNAQSELIRYDNIERTNTSKKIEPLSPLD